VAVAPIPLMVPITVFLTGDLVGAVVFVTTVVPELASVDWLLLLALPLAAFAAAPWGAFLPLPAPAVELADDEAVVFPAAVARVDFAFSTIFVKMPAAPPVTGGPMGFKGDTGLAR
jgi:hypothetical protein